MFLEIGVCVVIVLSLLNTIAIIMVAVAVGKMINIASNLASQIPAPKTPKNPRPVEDSGLMDVP